MKYFASAWWYLKIRLWKKKSLKKTLFKFSAAIFAVVGILLELDTPSPPFIWCLDQSRIFPTISRVKSPRGVDMAILRLLGLWITAPTICDDTKPQTTRQIQLSPRDGQYLGEDVLCTRKWSKSQKKSAILQRRSH